MAYTVSHSEAKANCFYAKKSFFQEKTAEKTLIMTDIF